MFESVNVIGRGRVGAAVAERLDERGVELREDAGAGPPLRPGRGHRGHRPGLSRDPWVAHVSGATPLRALDPHTLRFGMHPLQTFTRSRGAEQLDGAWAAVTAESDEARAHGHELARTLGLHPFDLADDARPVYHAGAAIASNYLVTLHRAATRLFEAAGAPPEALVPLMTRTIENGFELTGPIARGDWNTVDAHVRAIHDERPGARAHVRRAGGGDEGVNVVRTVAELREALPPSGDGRARADDGRAARRPRGAARARRARNATAS